MKRILLVESHQPVEGLSSSLFRRRECTLEVASSAAEALALVGASAPDLVLFDDLVDDRSAEELVQALLDAAAGADLPVLVLIGPEEAKREGPILRAGAAAVLTRPPDEVELNVKVCELLGISLRRHVRTFVKMKVDATVGGATHFATISNISLGGVLIESEKALKIGDIVKLSFFLPDDDDAITVIAKVVRKEGVHAHGCQFLDLADSARERILSFVTDQEGDE